MLTISTGDERWEVGTSGILTEALVANSEIVPLLNHFRFLLNPWQFISLCHLVLVHVSNLNGKQNKIRLISVLAVASQSCTAVLLEFRSSVVLYLSYGECFASFWVNEMTLCSGPNNVWLDNVLEMWHPEDDDTTTLRNTENCSPNEQCHIPEELSSHC